MNKKQLISEYWVAFEAAYGALPPKKVMMQMSKEVTEKEIKANTEYLIAKATNNK